MNIFTFLHKSSIVIFSVLLGFVLATAEYFFQVIYFNYKLFYFFIFLFFGTYLVLIIVSHLLKSLHKFMSSMIMQQPKARVGCQQYFILLFFGIFPNGILNVLYSPIMYNMFIYNDFFYFSFY